MWWRRRLLDGFDNVFGSRFNIDACNIGRSDNRFSRIDNGLDDNNVHDANGINHHRGARARELCAQRYHQSRRHGDVQPQWHQLLSQQHLQLQL